MSPAFVPGPALPVRGAQKPAVSPLRTIMSANAAPRSTTRRAFAAGALAACVGLVLPRPNLAAAAPVAADKKNSTPKTTTTTADPAKVATSLIEAVIKADPTIAATMLRLAFHDSFTFDVKSKKGGANGSIRLETGRGENFGLARAVDALVPIQAESGLSWGDTVALAGAVAVRATGGPDIPVTLGRVTAKSQDPTGILPNLTETVEELRRRFGPRGLDDRDIVALSGAHSLGRASGGGPFVKENTKFKNDYFKNLMWFQNRRERGLSVDTGPPERPNFQLPSDMGLLDDPSTLAIVREFANNQKAFFEAFKVAYTKMVSIGTPFMARS